MSGIITFIIIFGILVLVHEYGHFYFAKKSGILVREFAIGMGPKVFAHQGKDGTAYTIRILPLGGYVRMAGWGEDSTEIKTGSPAALTLNDQGLVTRINLSDKQQDQTSLPIYVTAYDLEDKLEITGRVLDETKTYKVDHDATIIEEDGTEIRIAPLDVQYQKASIKGRLITNFAGPMNNFILGILVFMLLVFIQGGVPNEASNQVRISPQSAVEKAGFQDNDRILKIENEKVKDWATLTDAVHKATANLKANEKIKIRAKTKHGLKTFNVRPKKVKGRYTIGVMPALKTGLTDKVAGAFKLSWDSAFRILNALKNLILHPNLNKLGGPVAIYQMSSTAAKEGIIQVLELMALLSINLGIFNLIPIPALDGGKILINLIEAVRKKPLRQETETYVTLAGVLVMVALMIAVTWNDIMRTFF
ncbi:RIP metalloprotease RseP [Streptococcus macacae]|uniref:Zinc metalloprotease n=1 Tax=Streptococcus macacae NCTC 11558 TaxID=764298 RepID=G5JWU8_9STRE|nr:RIP metalloprotease RseP [Streptococcus macacae]EHJ53230.1 RIP metalloprotease RseP [Streptococcus macacae NCTC 11558]SUN79056.1 Eep protein-like protein [Streptococcus macacae NCTC 11558]